MPSWVGSVLISALGAVMWYALYAADRYGAKKQGKTAELKARMIFWLSSGIVCQVFWWIYILLLSDWINTRSN